MHPHIYVSARGSNLFPLGSTRSKLTDAHNPQLVETAGLGLKGASQTCPWYGSPQQSARPV